MTSCHRNEVVIRINDLTVEQTFGVPLKKTEGWVTRSIAIIENTANDTVKLGVNLIAPKWTGSLYVHDEYNSEPSEFTYIPYKATTGSISIRYRISK